MKTLRNTLLLLSVAMLSACGVENASTTPSGATIKNYEMITSIDGESILNMGFTMPLLFKKGSEIPYVSLKSGFQFFDVMKSARRNAEKPESYYKIAAQGDNYVVTNDTGASVKFDTKAQTVTYSDIDHFCSFNSVGENPITLTTVKGTEKAFKVTSTTFTKGSEVTVDLKRYEGIDLYVDDGMAYLPLTTFNDMFYNVFETSNIAFNTKELFIVLGNLSKNTPSGRVLTTFGKRFYDVSARETLSEELLRYNYQEACLVLDNFYGLKKEKGLSSFADFINEKDFKADFDNPNTQKADAALRYALSQLNDGHSAGTSHSYFYDFATNNDDHSRMHQGKDKWLDDSDMFQKSRPATAALGNHLEASTKTYFISFNEFTPIDEKVLYLQGAMENPDAVNASTALQFAAAYKYLTSEEGKANVRNVVVDLTTNDGGASDALIYSLCTLLGEIKTNTMNPISGAKNKTNFKADLNLDGKVDEKDVGLMDLGFSVTILSSIYSFSSANALPALAKANNAKVITAGEKTAGGTCVASTKVSPLGASYVISGDTMICTEVDGQYVNVEKGVPADIAIAQSSMFDHAFIGTKINEYLAK